MLLKWIRMLTPILLVGILFALPVGRLDAQENHDLQLKQARSTFSENRGGILFAGAFQPGLAIPHWDKGYLVSQRLISITPGTPNVWLYNANGNEIRQAAIWIPGSVRVFVAHAGVTADGRIVVSGIAEQKDSTQGFFLALTDITGNTIKVIQTNPYVSEQLCVAPDGTVWTAGGIRTRDSKAQKAAEVFRHFDFDRGLIGAYLPLSSMGSGSAISTAGFGREVYFGCNGDRVVLYSGVAHQLVEFMTSNNTIHRWTVVPPPHDLPVNGFAITASGNLYGSLYAQGSPSTHDGLYYLQADDSAGPARWLPVASSDSQHSPRQSFGYLYGAEGNLLLHSRKGEGLNTLYQAVLSR